MEKISAWKALWERIRKTPPLVQGLYLLLPVALTVLVHNTFLQQEQQDTQILNEFYREAFGSLKLVLTFTILDPIKEEVIYRGPAWVLLLAFVFLWKKFPDKHYLKIVGYTLVTATLLVALYFWVRPHQYPLTLFGYGLVLGWLLIRTRNIFYPIILHICINSLALFGMMIGFHQIYQ